MKYSIHNHIRVFYRETEGSGASPDKNRTIVEKAENPELIKHLKGWVDKARDAIISQESIKKAINTLTLWKGAGDAQQHQDLLAPIFASIEGQVRYNRQLYDANGVIGVDRSAAIIELKRIIVEEFSKIPVKITTQPESKSEPLQGQAKEKALLQKYGDIDSFCETYANKAIAHPIASQGQVKSIQDELDSLPDSTALHSYRVVIQTILAAYNNPVFRKNTGWAIEGSGNNGDFAKSRSQFFGDFFRDLLRQAANTGSVQRADSFGKNREYSILTTEDIDSLRNNPPNKFEDMFLKGVSGGGGLTRETAQKYLKGLRGSIEPIYQKLPKDNGTRILYEQKFDQLGALAQNDILFDSWSQFAGKFTGNTLERFLHEYKSKSATGNGAMGFDEAGKYRFYTLNEMEKLVMSGDITGTADIAWDNYIKSTDGDIGKISSVFDPEALLALGMYIQEKPESSIANGAPMKKFVSNLGVYEKTHRTGDALELGEQSAKEGKRPKFTEKLTIQSDFPNLNALSIDINKNINIPLETDGTVNAITLAYVLLNGKSGTPEHYKQVLKAIEQDFALREKQWQDKKVKEKEKLIGLGYTGWADIEKKLGLEKISYQKNGKPDTVSLGSDFDQRPSGAEREALIKALRKKQEEHPEKKEDIEAMLQYLHAEKKVTEARVVQKAANTASPADMSKSQDDPIAKNAIAQATHTAAKSSVRQEENKESLQKKAPQILEFLRQHGVVVQNVSELAHPRYRNTVNDLIRELETGGRDEDRDILVGLKQIRYQTEVDAEAVHTAYQLAQAYPEYSETVDLIKQSNTTVRDAIDNPENHTLAAYLCIDSLRSLSPVEQGIMSAKIDGGPQSIEHLISSTPGARDLADLSNFTKKASVERKSHLECEVNFGTSPTGRHLDAVSGIPISGFDSFLIQAELYSKLGLHSLIPLIPALNHEISKKTGKKTDFADGKFDIQEIRRNLQTLSVSLLGIEITGQESIDELKRKIATKYPAGQKEIQDKFIQDGILRREGGYSQAGLEKAIWGDI